MARAIEVLDAAVGSRHMVWGRVGEEAGQLGSCEGYIWSGDDRRIENRTDLSLIEMSDGLISYIVVSNQVFHPHRCGWRYSIADEVEPGGDRLDIAILT